MIETDSHAKLVAPRQLVQPRYVPEDQVVHPLYDGQLFLFHRGFSKNCDRAFGAIRVKSQRTQGQRGTVKSITVSAQHESRRCGSGRPACGRHDPQSDSSQD